MWLKVKIPPVAPEMHLQKLKRSPFAATGGAMERERPQKLLVAPR